MATTLRKYQLDAIDEIFLSFKMHETNVILNSPPGSGKTTIASAIIKDCIKNNFPVVFCVRSRELVKNASRTLDRYKIDHSVFMAGSPRFNKSKLIQVCSADTMNARKDYPFSDKECLLILDEQHKDYSKVIEAYSRGFILGLSGTPYNHEMNKYFHRIITPVEAYELRDQGYLVDFVTYCPNIMDTSKVSVRNGDFKKDELNSMATDGAIVGDIVQDYIKYGEDRPSVCFAVSVEHSKMLTDEFNRQGISAVHCDANSSEAERDAARIGLESGKIKVVCNVDIFSVGWDCPAVSCIIMARPTWSLIWYLQALGRGNRSLVGKHNCIVIDSAGNVFRHGLFYEVREIELGSKKEKKEYKEKVDIKTCKACFKVYQLSASRMCPYCGQIEEQKGRKIKTADGELSLYSESVEQRKSRMVRECAAHFRNCEWIRRSKKINNPNFSMDSCIKKYGQEIFDLMTSQQDRSKKHHATQEKNV